MQDNNDFTMSDNDLAPNAGFEIEPPFYPEETEERLADDQEEAQRVGTIAVSYPIVSKNLEWFSEAATACDSIDNIDLESGIPAEAQILAFKLLKTKMQEKMAEYREAMESYEP